MLRHLLNLLPLLSLLLCLAAASMWCRSYWQRDVPGIITKRGAHWILSSRGQVGWLSMQVPAPQQGWRIFRYTPDPPSTSRSGPTPVAIPIRSDWQSGAAGFSVSGAQVGRVARFSQGNIRVEGDTRGDFFFRSTSA